MLSTLIVICVLLLCAAGLFTATVALLRNVVAIDALEKTGVKLVHMEGGKWLYRFEDQYGAITSRAGFHTQWGAARAAQRHRDQLAKELQEALGL